MAVLMIVLLFVDGLFPTSPCGTSKVFHEFLIISPHAYTLLLMLLRRLLLLLLLLLLLMLLLLAQCVV